jgi:hypothetical protein
MEHKDDEDRSYDLLVINSNKFKTLKKELESAVRLSVTGITNLVINYEDFCLVESFLKSTFKMQELYRQTFDIDAIELQKGAPGRGNASEYIETLIFGSLEMQDAGGAAGGLDIPVPKVDGRTGKRKRKADGFVSRKEILTSDAKDRLLVIRNIDYSLDFCAQKPGVVDARTLWIFDNFRNPSVKLNCRILLISNEPLKMPFKVRTIRIDPVDDCEANHIIDCFTYLYESRGYIIDFTDYQKTQVVRKLNGLTYTEAADAFSEALSRANKCEADDEVKEIDTIAVLKNLREKINKNLMEDACGLTHLTAKPWEDYICPETSNFTYDVKKIVRDFDEIKVLREEEHKLIKSHKDNELITKDISAIRARMPHIIVLYGKGGVGKSAFPIHFAGLLEFDVWDFNVNAAHSRWVGEGSERMREALRKISKASHVVVRIDEYDRAMGSSSASGSGMHEAHKQVEAEFMNWLQNSQEDSMFVKNDIFVILTTNHKENITGPLLRSGRADLVIDINDFDEKSMRQTFLTAARRMKNRGVVVPVGFASYDLFQKDVESLDLDKLVPLASTRGFTVRDVDILLQEMAAHNYYYNKTKNGIPWTNEMFVKVLENSTGSTKGQDTCELLLGDRCVLEQTKKDDAQKEFAFADECSKSFNFDKFTDVNFFKQ